MKIVKFKGGLGNQLFQYSFLRALQLKYKCDNVKADFSYYTNVKNDSVRIPRILKLNVKFNLVTEHELSNFFFIKHTGNPMSLVYKSRIIFEKMLNRKYYFEMNREYRNVKKMFKYDYLDGYWQSWRYMNGIEHIIRKELTLKKDFSERTEVIIDGIKNQNAVFIGIRRGDYLSTSRNRKHFGNLNIDYYYKSIEFMKKHVENPIFYIFSNDIDWVKQNMKFDCNVIFRDDEYQTSDVEELFIMQACKHAIIVNSTFYWWGAWLINNVDKIVIAPKKWFADEKPIDIIPDSWIKM
ncbi:alpha-1,2-fucosyltransferase [Helicovermis profundi]|uniref:Alpha-1,2-fucosyltransferase n=1 Tax=Helicovermis profundi TaxID=3065157 RepID=A0AAU9E6J1_9FIRM|nr:alpha-1,2-fucosyltransferase [Clostridia bacterium S502]